MTVVCLVILAGIFWGDFFLKNYIGCCFTGVYTDIDRCLYRESGTSRQQFAATGTIAVAWWCLQQYL